jgi:hypothetical protein
MDVKKRKTTERWTLKKVMSNSEKVYWQIRFMAAILDGIFVACIGNAIALSIALICLHYRDAEMGGLVFILILIVNTVICFLTGAFGFAVPLIAIAILLLKGNSGILVVIPAAFPLIVSLLYQILMETSSQQATLGKRIMGLAVVNKNGIRISISTALLRYFLKDFSGCLVIKK